MRIWELKARKRQQIKAIFRDWHNAASSFLRRIRLEDRAPFKSLNCRGATLGIAGLWLYGVILLYSGELIPGLQNVYTRK